MTDPLVLLSKLEWEGSEAVNWFTPEEFVDSFIQEQLAIAIKASNELEISVAKLNKHIEENYGEKDG